MTAFEGWITTARVAEALREAKSSVTEHQLERWRGQGLMPRSRPVGRGRGKGSTAYYPPGTVAQAIEIARLFGIREKRAWVGWQLWLRGFPVDDRYWRHEIHAARGAVGKAIRLARQYSADMEAGNEELPIAEIMAAVRGTPLFRPLANLDGDIFETLVGFAAEIALGTFTGFSLVENNKPNPAELSAVSDLTGAHTSESHVVLGQKLVLEPLLAGALENIALAFPAIELSPDPSEPSPEIRQEFVHVIALGTNLYRSLAWLFGRSAFGMGVMGGIAADPAIKLNAAMLLVWGALRTNGSGLLSSLAISDLAELATDLAALSDKLQMAISESDPANPIRNLPKLKSALSDPRKLQIQLDLIRNYMQLTSK